MKFTTGEIISAGTGILCCKISDLYRIMNYLTGDDLYTHQLPRAFKTCEAWVRTQHPWLNDLNTDACTPNTWAAWLLEAINKYGEVFDLLPLPAGQWKSRDPIKEALEMKKRVIKVKDAEKSRGF